MNASHISREFSKPHIRAFIAHEVRRTITTSSMRASARLVELIDAQSEHVSADVSRHILAIDGVKPAENATNVSINNTVQAGFVINLAPMGTQAGDRLAGDTREVSGQLIVRSRAWGVAGCTL